MENKLYNILNSRNSPILLLIKNFKTIICTQYVWQQFGSIESVETVGEQLGSE